MTERSDSVPSNQGAASTCASCGAQTADPALEGWHLFEDGLGEEHALCSGCIHGISETDVPPEAES